MSSDYLEVWMGEQFMCALAYDDASGLTDEEEEQLSRFLCVDVQHEVGNYYDEITDERDEFGVCEVTGLRGAVVKVRFWPVQVEV